jgi:hypothetical protein
VADMQDRPRRVSGLPRLLTNRGARVGPHSSHLAVCENSIKNSCFDDVTI